MPLLAAVSCCLPRVAGARRVSTELGAHHLGLGWVLKHGRNEGGRSHAIQCNTMCGLVRCVLAGSVPARLRGSLAWHREIQIITMGFVLCPMHGGARTVHQTLNQWRKIDLNGSRRLMSRVVPTRPGRACEEEEKSGPLARAL